MKKTTKKGFTIVELVIVIAVIAVLAAVLIPTFLSLLRKSRVSVDTQLIRNLNLALAEDRITDVHYTMTDALNAAEDSGFDVTKINAKARNNEILWDSANDVFCYLNDGKLEYLNNDVLESKQLSIDGNNNFKLWKIYNQAPTGDEPYSIYVASAAAAQYVRDNEVSVGVDCGKESVSKVNYKTNGTAKKGVVIRTNAFDTKLTVTGHEQDEVVHYGYAGTVDVVKVAPSSYQEKGVVGRLTVTEGHVSVQSDAIVYQLVASAGDQSLVSIQAGSTVYDREGVQFEGALTKSTTEFVLDAADDCAHERTDIVVDGRYVYEVCKDCGHTVITIISASDTEKMTCVTESGDKKIVPVATYTVDGDKVSVSGNDAVIADDAVPTVETPVVEGEAESRCQHLEWRFVDNGDGTHTATCKGCGITYVDKHLYDAENICTKCGYELWVRKYWYDIELRFGSAPDGYSEDGDVITISTNNGLGWLAKQANAGNNYAGKTVQLAANIDLLDYYWAPIDGFRGTFDGKGYTVSNLYIVDDDRDGSGYGLFGTSSPAAIRNVNLSNVYIEANSALGALLGDGNTAIDNVNVSGNIYIGVSTENGFAPNYNSAYVGGIVGHGYSTVSNSSVVGNSGSFVGGGRQVGGVYGFSSEGNRTIVTNCTVRNITVQGTISVGGLVGFAHYNNDIIGNTVDTVKVVGTNASVYSENATRIGFVAGDLYAGTAENNGMICAANTVTNSELYQDTTMLTDEATVYTMYASYVLGECYATDGANKVVFFNTVNDALAYAADNDTKTIVLLKNAAADVAIPDGVTVNENGFIFADGNAVLFTLDGNSKKYATLEELCTYLQSSTFATGATPGKYQSSVVLLKDITVSSEIELSGSEHNLVFDLYGHTITSTAADVFKISNSAVWTVKDTVGGGKIDQTAGDELLYAPNDGKVVIESGIINSAGSPLGWRDAILEIKGGTFNQDPTAYVDGSTYVVTANGDGTWTVSSKAVSLTLDDETQLFATIEEMCTYLQSSTFATGATPGKYQSSVVLLKDITVGSEIELDGSQHNLVFDLNGHTLTSTAADVFKISNSAVWTVKDTVGGGKIDQTSGDELLYAPNNGKVVIESGIINSAGSPLGWQDAILEIKGGTFNQDPTAYVDGSAYDVVDNGDGTWTVSAKA